MAPQRKRSAAKDSTEPPEPPFQLTYYEPPPEQAVIDRGEFLGVPATGKQITVKGMVVHRVVARQDGRESMDGLSMMRQLAESGGIANTLRS